MPEVSDDRYAPTYRYCVQSRLYKHFARVFPSFSPYLSLALLQSRRQSVDAAF